MQGERVFGRTSFGTQEILHKSGRLTQSERLVLIVLGDQMAFSTLLAKLSALSPDRIDQALVRLIELNLAYEVLVPSAESVGTTTIPVNALQTFLAQTDSDPVTVMASAQQLEATARGRALKESVGEVLQSVALRQQAKGATVAVPLGKFFPEVITPPAEDMVREGRVKEQRERAGRQIEALEGALEAVATGMASGSRSTPGGQRSASDIATPTVDPEREVNGGSIILVIGGVVALAVVTTLVIYAVR